jgi:hypothetical protein
MSTSPSTSNLHWSSATLKGFPATKIYNLYLGGAPESGGKKFATVTLHGAQDTAGYIIERNRRITDHAHIRPNDETSRHPMFDDLEDAKVYTELLAEGMAPITPEIRREPIRSSRKTIRIADDTKKDQLRRCTCGAALRVRSDDPISQECGGCGRKYDEEGHVVERPAIA